MCKLIYEQLSTVVSKGYTYRYGRERALVPKFITELYSVIDCLLLYVLKVQDNLIHLGIHFKLTPPFAYL